LKHDGKLPNSSEDKADFKKLLTSWRRKGDEENFDEALAQAYRVWTSSAVSKRLKLNSDHS
jgi:amyloid beta precursor protein binding protein 1